MKTAMQIPKSALKSQFLAVCAPQTGSLEGRIEEKIEKHVEVWKFFQESWSQDCRINRDTIQASINISAFVPTNWIHCISQHCFPMKSNRTHNLVCRTKVESLLIKWICRFTFVLYTCCLEYVRQCVTNHDIIWEWVTYAQQPWPDGTVWLITLDKVSPSLDLWRWRYSRKTQSMMDCIPPPSLPTSDSKSSIPKMKCSCVQLC